MMLVVGGSFVVIAAIRLSPIAPQGLLIDILISQDCLQDLRPLKTYCPSCTASWGKCIAISIHLATIE